MRGPPRISEPEALFPERDSVSRRNAQASKRFLFIWSVFQVRELLRVTDPRSEARLGPCPPRMAPRMAVDKTSVRVAH